MQQKRIKLLYSKLKVYEVDICKLFRSVLFNIFDRAALLYLMINSEAPLFLHDDYKNTSMCTVYVMNVNNW